MKEGEQLRLFIENQPKSKIGIARDLNISKQTLFQYFKSTELAKETKEKFEGYFKKKIFGKVSMTNADHKGHILNEPDVNYSQPIFQVVLNLSYTSKKNADSIDKMADSVKGMTAGVNTMAATNQRNIEIIAALIEAFLPNSKLGAQATASLADLHKEGDRPVEDFLPPGTDLSKPPKVKKEEKSR